MSYPEIVAADRRLLILKALDNAAGYRAPARLLSAFLDSFGQKVSADQMAGELAWLEEQGLVDLQQTEGETIATLKPRGADIAAGRARHPGVRRPAIGE